MSYQKQTWAAGDTIGAAALNHIEEGVFAADSAASAAQSTADSAADAASAAQSTADNAASAASAAQNTADSAADAASAAQSTADNAASAASAAQNTADSAQADATKALGKLVTARVQGTTDAYGKIDLPDSTIYPLAALSNIFMISGEYNLRVLNVSTDSAVLAKNTAVDFWIIGLKK